MLEPLIAAAEKFEAAVARRDRHAAEREALVIFIAELILEVLDRTISAVSYTHLRAHETVLDLVCRLLLEKKKQQEYYSCVTV